MGWRPCRAATSCGHNRPVRLGARRGGLTSHGSRARCCAVSRAVLWALLVELAPASFAIAGERFHAVLIMHSPESRVLRLHHNIAIVLLTIRRQTNTRLPRIVTFWLRIEA